MLRNSSEIFISQSTSRKFLDTLEELLSSPRTSPVVRERVLEVVAAAAYASGNSKLMQIYEKIILIWNREGCSTRKGRVQRALEACETTGQT
jgi:hypothetical protein